jgi:plasmid maintenance system antidote protein VapI
MLSLSTNSFEERIRRLTDAFVREGLISRRKLAGRLRFPEKELQRILDGEQKMTPDLANRIMNELSIEPHELYLPEELAALFGR